MGRSLKSAEAIPSVGEAWALRAPRIYYLHPQNVGGLPDCTRHITLAAALGFDHICVGPIFEPARGDPFLISDLETVDPRLGIAGSPENAVREIAALCRGHGLSLFLDIVLDRLAADGPSMRQADGLYERRDHRDMVDPRQDRAAMNVAAPRPGAISRLVPWWTERLVRLVRAGASGFRLMGLDLLPGEAVRQIVGATRGQVTCGFWGWTPGVDWARHADLIGAGLDGVFASTAWWDGRAGWYVEEYESLRRVAPVIGLVEAPLRVAPLDIGLRQRALRLAATTAGGLMMPAGFETDLEAEVTETTQEAGCLASFGATGEMRRLTGASAAVTVLARLDAADGRAAESGIIVLINNDLSRSQPISISLDPLDPAAGALLGNPRTVAGEPLPDRLAPGEVRVARVSRIGAVRDGKRQDRRAANAAALRSPVVIERVTPQVSGGPFAAKRIIGRPITVEADIFADGHDVLAAELLWQAADEKDWQRAPLVPIGNDRWRGVLLPKRIGRHLFTIEAWRDEYATLCHALEVKHRAGIDVATEIADARAHLVRLKLDRTLAALSDGDVDQNVTLLTGPETRRRVAEADDRALANRHEPIAVEVERPQAEFASWYELFPRSLGTFDDVIKALPRIHDMGFDVLYFPPISPIGTTNRKGRNNALKAGPDDPGSPYAIGGVEGGHDAIHPALGTPEDFRRLVAAASEHGLEIALDFAIQCSLDHPWLKEHPQWFRRRADGSIRYAENPPKKYEDIVNVDFHAEGAVPDLWLALRDVVQHWIGEGVRIFRVDNPHTKPLPFWEWMIADIRGRHPDTIFLAEAFTRPTMMYRLAKVGFSQSYTYFTWRNTKVEFTDYLRELTTTDVADYFRPHFFVNTPDINPYFLQSSGRAGFLIRAVLASTLSGLWGVYSGFELCEAAALPGREEYLDSEKYEIRRRDFSASGNIVAEITNLNRLRKLHPALQSHLDLRFYNAFNDQVMVYGKMTPAREDMILVAVSFDPHGVQEAAFEVPLWEWNLPDDGAVEVEDLMRGRRFAWQGKIQHLRLDPADLPFAIWRIAPRGSQP
jgi:starch synthase (maltosyl-transferring)